MNTFQASGPGYFHVYRTVFSKSVKHAAGHMWQEPAFQIALPGVKKTSSGHSCDNITR